MTSQHGSMGFDHTQCIVSSKDLRKARRSAARGIFGQPVIVKRRAQGKKKNSVLLPALEMIPPCASNSNYLGMHPYTRASGSLISSEDRHIHTPVSWEQRQCTPSAGTGSWKEQLTRTTAIHGKPNAVSESKFATHFSSMEAGANMNTTNARNATLAANAFTIPAFPASSPSSYSSICQLQDLQLYLLRLLHAQGATCLPLNSEKEWHSWPCAPAFAAAVPSPQQWASIATTSPNHSSAGPPPGYHLRIQPTCPRDR